MRRFGWVLAASLLGCRSLVGAGEPELVVSKLEISFPTGTRGELELGLKVQGGGRATRVQWQLMLDGQPLGSGVQLVAVPLEDQKGSVVGLKAPLLVPHAARDDGWRTVTLELSGELTVQRRLEERMPFALRKQALIRGAPRL